MDISDLSHLQKVVGLKQVLKQLSLGRIQTVILATDAEPDFEKQVKDAAAANGVPVIVAETKTRLAELCGIDKIATVVAILKQG